MGLSKGEVEMAEYNPNRDRYERERIQVRQAGRSPNGKIRNFKAMSDTKLQAALTLMIEQDNDPEALERGVAEARSRGLKVRLISDPRYVRSANATDALRTSTRLGAR